MIAYWLYIYIEFILRFGLLKVHDNTHCFNLINFKTEFLPYSWIKDKEKTLKENSFQGTNIKPQLEEISLISSEQSDALFLQFDLFPMDEANSTTWTQQQFKGTLQALFSGNIKYSPLLLFAAINWSDKEILLESVKIGNIIWIYRNHWGNLS